MTKIGLQTYKTRSKLQQEKCAQC